VKHFSFDFRYERQFGVQAKSQGIYVIELTWLNIFPSSH